MLSMIGFAIEKYLLPKRQLITPSMEGTSLHYAYSILGRQSHSLAFKQKVAAETKKGRP